MRGDLPPAPLDIQPGVVGWEGPPVEEGAGLCEGAYEATTRLEMVQE